jgi:rhodanese-related sulfurtransferase
MYLITLEELKNKIDRKEDIKLVFTLGEFYFKAMHIPGSIHIDSPEKANGQIEKDDEIVVYCGSVGCPASIILQVDWMNGKKPVTS